MGGTDEQRILAWLTSAPSEVPPPPPAAAEPPASEAASTAGSDGNGPRANGEADAERSRELKARIRQLHASTLAREIRRHSPRLSPARAAEHAAAWSAILADPAHLDDWLAAGLRVQDHAAAARCIQSNITPAQLRPLRRDTKVIAQLRAGADPQTLLTG